MIDFTRAFDSAWERMMVILFRPFDLGKWFVIGFSAFLAGLLQGGNGVNGGSFNNLGNLNKPGGSQTSGFDFNQLHSSLSNAFAGVQLGLIIGIAVVVLAFVLALTLLLYWVGARGQFLFLDNIVRNRGEIAWPWQFYARQANSLFFFYLLFVAIAFAVFVPILVVAVVMCLPLFQHNRWPEGGEIAGFIVLGVVYFVLAVVFNFILFIFREFGVPLMFRNGLLVRAAFGEAMGLLREHAGSVVIFVLLRFAIAIGVGIISIIACCFCCIVARAYL